MRSPRQPSRPLANGLTAAEGQSVDDVDDRHVADVEGGETLVGAKIEGIGNESGGVAGGGLVQESPSSRVFDESVDAAQQRGRG